MSQIASYALPEDVSCEPPPAATAAKPSLPATLDLTAAHAPLDRTDRRQESYEKCIARYEKGGQERYEQYGKIGGCLAGGGVMGTAVFSATKHPLPTALGALVGCVGGGLAGMVAAVSQGTASGATEGKIACDDLPRKP